MKRAAGGGFGFLHGIVRARKWEISATSPVLARVFSHVVALEIDVRIDFVSDAVVALIAFEADVVSRRAYPQHFAV